MAGVHGTRWTGLKDSRPSWDRGNNWTSGFLGGRVLLHWGPAHSEPAPPKQPAIDTRREWALGNGNFLEATDGDADRLSAPGYRCVRRADWPRRCFGTTRWVPSGPRLFGANAKKTASGRSGKSACARPPVGTISFAFFGGWDPGAIKPLRSLRLVARRRRGQFGVLGVCESTWLAFWVGGPNVT